LGDALVCFQRVGKRAEQANTLTNIGYVYDVLGDQQKALDYYSKALPLALATNDYKREIRALSYIAGIYEQRGETDRVIHYYKEIVPLAQILKDHRYESFASIAISRQYAHLGNLQKMAESNKAFAHYRW
jgi:tetratricopeptide (TPR) repeat protein